MYDDDDAVGEGENESESDTPPIDRQSLAGEYKMTTFAVDADFVMCSSGGSRGWRFVGWGRTPSETETL